MEIRHTRYDGIEIRYMVLPHRGLLFNTKDICELLAITDRTEGTALAESSLDLASAVNYALGRDESVAMWLNKQFVGYAHETLVRPDLDDDWMIGK